MIGNKGCIAYNFTLNDRIFNFVATHLRHGQDAAAERDQMASEIINELRLQNIQNAVPGIECDQTSSICIFMGDMNYRMNTTFEKFNNKNIEQAIHLFKSLDQLQHSMNVEKNYPGYLEPAIDFLPSYKLSKTANQYIDKKDQAPSYCDRILYKNNTSLNIQVLSYEALHHIQGSDHRPIVLKMVIKNFDKPSYYDLSNLLRSKQDYGLLSF